LTSFFSIPLGLDSALTAALATASALSASILEAYDVSGFGKNLGNGSGIWNKEEDMRGDFAPEEGMVRPFQANDFADGRTWS
jgi:hypothetical protein